MQILAYFLILISTYWLSMRLNALAAIISNQGKASFKPGSHFLTGASVTGLVAAFRMLSAS